MTVFSLVLRTLRHRAGGSAASFLALLFGATVLMAFASMLDVAIAGDARGPVRETLVVMASVVGGWGLMLVVLAVASTLTLAVRQRAAETALLKSLGATPARLTRAIVGEAAVLAVAAGALAVVPGALAGRGVLALLHSTDQVPEEIGYAFGPVAPALGIGIVLVAAVVAALVAARRTTRGPVVESLTDAETGRTRMSRKRAVAAGLFLALGVDLAVVTMTAMRDEEQYAMATAGQADILASVGLALLAPVLVRWAVGLLAGPLRLAGAAGELAAAGLRRRTGQAAAVVTPIVLFTGIGIGTLYMQATENEAARAAGQVAAADQENVHTLNLVVIGMIVVFTALMVVNTMIAATAHRRREFGQQRLAGATPGQVLGAAALEGVVLALVGLACGTVASLFTIMPFASVRAGSAVPGGGPWIYAGMAAVAVVLTLATALGGTRRALRTPAVAAVAA
ncbi:FtsX-like permease family protein [Spirillospora sp. NPDC050679]